MGIEKYQTTRYRVLCDFCGHATASYGITQTEAEAVAREQGFMVTSTFNGLEWFDLWVCNFCQDRSIESAEQEKAT